MLLRRRSNPPSINKKLKAMSKTESLKNFDKHQYVGWLKKLSKSQLDQEENNISQHLELALPSVTLAENKLNLLKKELSIRK